MKLKELTPKQEEHIALSKYHIDYYITDIKKRDLNLYNLNLNEIQHLVANTEYFLLNLHTLNELLRLKLKSKYDWKTKIHTKEINVKINKETHSEVFTDNIDLIIAKANLFDEMVNRKYIISEIKLLEK